MPPASPSFPPSPPGIFPIPPARVEGGRGVVFDGFLKLFKILLISLTDTSWIQMLSPNWVCVLALKTLAILLVNARDLASVLFSGSVMDSLLVIWSSYIFRFIERTRWERTRFSVGKRAVELQMETWFRENKRCKIRKVMLKYKWRNYKASTERLCSLVTHRNGDSF